MATTFGRLTSVWGSSPNSVFAVGTNGRVSHFDGSTWTETFVGTGSTLQDVWGSSASDVYAVAELNRVRHFDGTRWGGDDSELIYQYGIWGTSPNNVYVAGGEGVGHFDGTTWTVDTSMGFGDLWAIWGSSDHDIFVVGGLGTATAFHFDGVAWESMATNSECSSLNAVWGTSASNVYALGSRGSVSKIIRYDGANWSVTWESTPGQQYQLRSIWGSSASNIYAVGNGGLVLHYDGSEWTPVDIGTAENLSDIWGSSASDIYIVGASSSPEPSINGVIFHYGSE